MSAQRLNQMSRLLQRVYRFVESQAEPVPMERILLRFADNNPSTIRGYVSRLGERGYLVQVAHGVWTANREEHIPADVIAQAKRNIAPLVQQTAAVAMKLEVGRIMRERARHPELYE